MSPARIPSYFSREPETTYHAMAKECLSSHQLAEFRRCPLLYHKRKLGLLADEDRPAYQVGRAAHKSILEGKAAFEKAYAVGGPVNPKTGEPYGIRTKAYEEWAATQGKPVLSDEQADLVGRLTAGVQAHEVAKALLTSGTPEGVVRAEYRGIRSQIRVDWFNPAKGIVDLKTCDDLTWFEADARRHGYAHQLAFYRAVLAEAAGEKFPVYFVAVEKKEPYRCGVWRVGEEVLGIAQKENEIAIDRLKSCRESNTWETGYEAIRNFDWL